MTPAQIKAEGARRYPDLIPGTTFAVPRRNAFIQGARWYAEQMKLEAKEQPDSIDVALIDKYPNQINKVPDNSF